MKKKEQLKKFQEMGVDELKKQVSELDNEMMNLRFKQGSRQLEQSSQLRLVRTKFAQAKTVLRQVEARK